MKRLAPFVFAGLMAAGPVSAQVPFFGGPDQPDLAIDSATRAAVIESLAVNLEAFYVFPDKGNEMARQLRRRHSRREYDRVTGAKAFAESLTSHMRAVTHDLHLAAIYSHEPVPAMRADAHPDEATRARDEARSRSINYGFEQVRRLTGNVGYLDLRFFMASPDAMATGVAAMNLLANFDAFVIDLRKNGGGSPAMIQLLLSYFVPEGEPVHINDFFDRPSGEITQWWSLPHVSGKRLDGRPLYVLTSRRTGSAAEEFAYDVQNLKLGTLVGETTAGAAHPVRFTRLGEHFGAAIATGRAINPVTKTNWEGVGVKPDVAAKANTALRVAHVAAIEALLAASPPADKRALLERSLERAKSAPDEVD
jgi:hypothetical protein